MNFTTISLSILLHEGHYHNSICIRVYAAICWKAIALVRELTEMLVYFLCNFEGVVNPVSDGTYFIETETINVHFRIDRILIQKIEKDVMLVSILASMACQRLCRFLALNKYIGKY